MEMMMFRCALMGVAAAAAAIFWLGTTDAYAFAYAGPNLSSGYVLVDSNAIEPAGVSGQTGITTTLEPYAPASRKPGENALLREIGGGEQSGNQPCYLEFGWNRKTSILTGGERDGTPLITNWLHSPCDGKHSFESTGISTVEYPGGAYQGAIVQGIGEINVCLNDGKNVRLKGMKITKVRHIT